jgi:hypothetical protein
MRIAIPAFLFSLGACMTAKPVVQRPAPTPQSRSDTVAIKAVLTKTFSVPDSAVGPWVLIRGDTAWAWVRADSITADLARLERRANAWVYVRIVGSAIK